MSDDANEKTTPFVTAFMFRVIALVVGVHLLLDSRGGVGLLHVVLEGAVLVLALVGMVAMIRRFRQVGTDLALARGDAARWHADNQTILKGVSAAIRSQLMPGH